MTSLPNKPLPLTAAASFARGAASERQRSPHGEGD